MKRAVLTALALSFVIGGAAIGYATFKKSNGNQWGAEVDVDPDAKIPETLTEFKLTDQDGRIFSSNDLKGKVWLGNFFFASCTAECPAQNRKLQFLVDEFSSQGMHTVSISCDPETDTPSRLAEYSRQFGADSANWHFLSGASIDYIQQVANQFFLLAVKRFTHSDQVVLFDRDGEVHGVYSIMNAGGFLEAHEAIKKLLENDGKSEGTQQPADDSIEEVNSELNETSNSNGTDELNSNSESE